MEKRALKNKKQKEGSSLEANASTPTVSFEVKPGESVIFVSNGNFHSMPKGEEYEVSSEDALVLLTKGYGEIKK
jgi:hypothetical protein